MYSTRVGELNGAGGREDSSRRHCGLPERAKALLPSETRRLHQSMTEKDKDNARRWNKGRHVEGGGGGRKVRGPSGAPLNAVRYAACVAGFCGQEAGLRSAEIKNCDLLKRVANLAALLRILARISGAAEGRDATPSDVVQAKRLVFTFLCVMAHGPAAKVSGTNAAQFPADKWTPPAQRTQKKEKSASQRKHKGSSGAQTHSKI
jgi:hypothetical protein